MLNFSPCPCQVLMQYYSVVLNPVLLNAACRIPPLIDVPHAPFPGGTHAPGFGHGQCPASVAPWSCAIPYMLAVYRDPFPQ